MTEYQSMTMTTPRIANPTRIARMESALSELSTALQGTPIPSLFSASCIQQMIRHTSRRIHEERGDVFLVVHFSDGSALRCWVPVGTLGGIDARGPGEQESAEESE